MDEFVKPSSSGFSCLPDFLSLLTLGTVAVAAPVLAVPQSESVYDLAALTTKVPAVKATSQLQTAPLSKNAVHSITLIPSRGPWHTFVHITGDRMGDVTSVRTVWYPNDDDTQPPLGSMSTTLRGANPMTGAEIEIPADAGGPKGGVVRIMVTLKGEKKPLFAGRFTVDNALAVKGTTFQPQVITTEAIQFTGNVRPPFQPQVITTEAIQFTGTRLRSLDVKKPLPVIIPPP